MVKTRVLLVIAAAILVVLPCVHVSLAASDPAREGRAASVQAQSVCPYVPNTPSFTFAYGDVLKDGLPAPVGSGYKRLVLRTCPVQAYQCKRIQRLKCGRWL